MYAKGECLIESLNLRTRLKDYLKPAKNAGFFICPICGSGTGPKKTGALKIDNSGLRCKCFACGFYGDIFDIVAKQYGLDNRSAYKKTRELLNGEQVISIRSVQPAVPEPAHVNDFSSYIAECAGVVWNAPTALAYLRSRGFSDATIRQFRLGYDAGCGQIVIPYGENYYIRRGVGEEKRYFKPPSATAGPEPLFGGAALAEAACVFVVESQLCAISVEQAGGRAVALGGTGGEKLLTALDSPEQQAKGTKPPMLVLALDNDERGRQAARRLGERLAAVGVPFTEANLAGAHKDPNEALQHEPAALAARVAEAAKAALLERDEKTADERASYKEQSAAGYLALFAEGIKAAADTPAIPTGFAALDEALDGGLYEGLYILGALSSLGKTTFALQLADQIAESGRDVLVFSLEMARSELMAKSISRHSWLLCGQAGQAKTARGILAGQRYAGYSAAERALIGEAVAAYGHYAGRVFIHEGMGDTGAARIGECLEKHVRVTGRAPVVIVDYLQILAPAEPRATDKQNTDRAVFELKRLSRQHKTPVLAVSSLNRENYAARLTMAAFKESGAIEYSSDVLMGLQFRGAGEDERLTQARLDELKAAEVRRLELTILKNRNGKSGLAVNFDYRPMYNVFCEERFPAVVGARR